MSDNVVALKVVEVGEDYRFDPDDLLEKAKGQEFTRLAILGELPNGEIWMSGTANAGETFIMIERVKMKLIGA